MTRSLRSRSKSPAICLAAAAAPLLIGGLLLSFAPGPSLVLSSGRLAADRTVALPLTFDSASAGDTAALQWTIVYDPAVFIDIAVVEGPAAVTADKVVSCSGKPGSFTCLLSGFNQAAIPAGAVAIVQLAASESVKAGSVQVGVTGARGATPSGDPIAISATGGIVDTNMAAVLRSLECDPDSFDVPGGTGCTVSLTLAAPAGGASIQLTSSDSNLVVPGGVTIPAGSISVSFRVSAGDGAAGATVTLTAVFAGSTAATSLALTGLHPASLYCNPSSVTAGALILCAAQLSSSHPTAPVSLALSSSSPDAVVPGIISARSGQPNVTFQAITTRAASRQELRFTVSYRDAGVEQTVAIVPQSTPVLSVPRQQLVSAGDRLAFRVTAVDPGGSAVTLAAADVPAGAVFDPQTGDFSWTPSASQVGAYAVRFTASNTSPASSTADVVITVCSDKTQVLGLADSASFRSQQVCSPGSLASIFGANFTPNPPVALSSVPAPTELGGVRVRINGEYAALLYASKNQINFQCPQMQPGMQLELVVEGPLGSSDAVATPMSDATPGIFSIEGSGAGQGAILLAGTGDIAKDRNVIAPGQPAWPGDIISIYATGLGPANEVLGAGEAAPIDHLIGLRSSVTVTIGGLQGEVLFAGLAPTLVGVGQINVRIPDAVPLGSSVPLLIVVTPPGGTPRPSNVVTLAIERRP